MKKKTDEQLFDPSVKPRVEELVNEIKSLYKTERGARSARTNLALGQKFLELRVLVVGSDKPFNPKSQEMKKWGTFTKLYLKDCQASKSNTYRCAAAWNAAKAIVPERVLVELAHHEKMIGVSVTAEKPFGRYTEAVETEMEAGHDIESVAGIDAFLETVFDNPEKAAKPDKMHTMYNQVIKGLVSLHNLRHSLSNWLVNRGKVDPKTVQEMLRHAKVQTTLDLYTQGDNDNKISAQDMFCGLIVDQEVA